MLPDAPHQVLVMSAIYGPQGVKAGFTNGQCSQALQAALEHLVDRGAQAIILGCTELPLVIAADDALMVRGRPIRVVDPTDLLAKRCVSLVMSAPDPRIG